MSQELIRRAYSQYPGPDPSIQGLDWETWAFIMAINRHFNLLDYNMERQTVLLRETIEPSDALVDRFYRIHRAIIIADSTTSFAERSRKFLGLTSLTHLTIKELSVEIDFIVSRKLECLTVVAILPDPPQQLLMIDHVEPVLKISTKLRAFRYLNGMLSQESILSLRKNPIEFLDLQNVGVRNKRDFVDFLCNATALTKLAIHGTIMSNVQFCFFATRAPVKLRITHLWITMQTRLKHVYHTITECRNLRNIFLSFEKSELLKDMLEHLLQLDNLKKIIINYHPLRVAPNFAEEVVQITKYKEAMEKLFTVKNVTIQYLDEYDPTTDEY